VQSLPPGGVVIYEESLDRSLNLAQVREDVFTYPVPFDKITAAICPKSSLRKLVRNMVYVGVVAQLLAIDLDVVESSLRQQFSKKQKVFDMNFERPRRASTMPRRNLTKRDPFFIERMNKTEGKIIIEGNAACGMGAVFAGVTVIAWYPIYSLHFGG